MPIERTLSIIKPDAARRNLTGAINARIEEAGLRIIAQKRLRLRLEHRQGARAAARPDGRAPSPGIPNRRFPPER